MYMVDYHTFATMSDHLVKYYNYIAQEVLANHVSLVYITSDDQIADVLTKPLAAEAHQNLSRRLQHGLDGIEPTPGSIATVHQLQLRNLAKMRAAKKRLAKAPPSQ